MTREIRTDGTRTEYKLNGRWFTVECHGRQLILEQRRPGDRWVCMGCGVSYEMLTPEAAQELWEEPEPCVVVGTVSYSPRDKGRL